MIDSVQTLMERLRTLQVDRRGILIESLFFIVAYAVFLAVLPPAAPSRALVEALAVLVSSITAALLILIALPALPSAVRPAWLILALALIAWAAADFIKTFYLLLGDTARYLLFVPDFINLVAYILAAYGLLRYPSESRYIPTRFRFVLDAVISSGAIATLGWLMLARPVLNSSTLQFDWILITSYPIADLILLTLLFSVSLSSMMPRVTALFLGGGLVAFAFSDFAYSSLALFGPFRSGNITSLGWLVGAFLIGLGAMFEKVEQDKPSVSVRQTDTGLGAQFQKVLPVALVLVLFWYVLTDWRLRGAYSTIGVWMSLLLGLMLIVRLGIRAGEAELNNYWQLFKNLKDPTFVCDASGNIVLSNPAFNQLATPGGTNRSLFSVFTGLSPSSLQSVSEEKAAESIEVIIAIQDRKVPYLLSLNPVETDSRRVLIAGVAHNLSEQIKQRDTIQAAYDELHVLHGQLEELNTGLEQKVSERTATLMDAYKRLEEQNKVLQELDQLKSDFVSMVSHELRNPLNNLGGGLELLLTRPEGREADKSTLVLMQAEVQRLTRFVESILDVSAIETGRLELTLIPLEIASFIEGVFQRWGIPEETERIQIELQPDLPKVIAAQNALESVLRHLVDNAIKYAPEGLVIVSAERKDRHVRFEVRDFGPGIPEGKQNLLFGRFQRLDARDSQSVYGYGLGLYLSRRLLEEMDSRLEFEAPEDGGARFTFSLKVAKK